jgi:hypothetical protein
MTLGSHLSAISSARAGAGVLRQPVPDRRNRYSRPATSVTFSITLAKADTLHAGL